LVTQADTLMENQPVWQFLSAGQMSMRSVV